MNGLLALTAAGACAVLGMNASRKLVQREALLAAWDGALWRMEGAVAHSGAGLMDVLKQGAAEENAVLNELIRRLLASPAASPEALTAALPWDEPLSPEEGETLRACLRGLFSPTLPQQAQALSAARSQWAEHLRRCREKQEKDGKLFVSLGWLAGAAAFILLC
jgi:stage III sporulation protein AB